MFTNPSRDPTSVASLSRGTCDTRDNSGIARVVMVRVLFNLPSGTCDTRDNSGIGYESLDAGKENKDE